MSMQEALPGMPTEWTHEDTMRYLNGNPLPSDFLWRHRDGSNQPVVPRYAIKGGYGKWLRETPYFPGLFELIHDLLFLSPNVPAVDSLVDQLAKIRAERDGQGNLF